MMLKSAFGGNSRTCAIINCRPEDAHGDESLQSLRFGERCSMISNSSKVAATSLKSTCEAIDVALDSVRKQIETLETRGKQHLDSYQRLLASLSK